MIKRTHYAGELTEYEIGKDVVVMGWVQNRRDLGGVIFLDVRDVSGICQVVLDAGHLSDAAFDLAQTLRSECVVGIKGIVEERAEDTINLNLPTGTIDVRASELIVFSQSKRLPFEVLQSEGVKETLRLKYRYLDLRNPSVQSKMKLRQEVLRHTRQYLYDQRFTEFETPILTKSTPEGARDFLVPSRQKKGGFYALPQSPQVYKQLLMVGGMDRYFQIAKCFRDEDLRADRQPEFTQVDMELSFVDAEDVIALLEGLFASLMKSVKGIDLELPFKRLTYQEAMEKYGCDKPDLRFEMPMHDVTECVAKSDFTVFTEVIKKGGVVKALTVKKGALFTRSHIETLTQNALEYGGGGLAWIAIDSDGTQRSVLTKYFSKALMDELLEHVEAGPDDLIFFCAEPKYKAREILGKIRLDIGDLLGLRKSEHFAFAVVTDFPLFEYDESEGRYFAMHHPFTMAVDEDVKKFKTAPHEMRAKAYDIVLNGVELGSGSIRIHDPQIQAQMFETLGFEESETRSRFGFLLEAFEYGVPPHGGFAFGLDRFLMLITGASSIRDVIAFPKMKDGSCPMLQTPSYVDESQLEVLHIGHLQRHHDKVTVELEPHETIDHVAKLSMLDLTEEERKHFAKDLSDIIGFADQLLALDLEDVLPLYHVHEDTNAFRSDIVTPFEYGASIVIKVPKVVE